MTLLRLCLLSVLLGTSAIAAPSGGGGDGPAVRNGQNGPRNGSRARPRGGDREDRFLRAIQQHDPARYDKIIEIRSGHPRMHKQLIIGSASMLRGQQRNDDGRALFASIVDEVHGLHTLMTEIDSLPAKAKDKRRGDVQSRVSAIFDLRQKARGMQLQALEDRVKTMRDSHELRAKKKGEIVDEFTDGVMHTPGGL